MAACPAWSFRGFSSVFESVLNYLINNFKDKAVKAVKGADVNEGKFVLNIDDRD
jgi:hypothetical protein